MAEDLYQVSVEFDYLITSSEGRKKYAHFCRTMGNKPFGAMPCTPFIFGTNAPRVDPRKSCHYAVLGESNARRFVEMVEESDLAKSVKSEKAQR